MVDEKKRILVQLRNHYLRDTVTTASPAKLVTMLYDRLLVGINRVQAAMAPGPSGEDTIDLDRATDTAVSLDHESLDLINSELLRCQRIIEELRGRLDHEVGGEIATNLANLYSFCLQKLIEANVTKSATPLHPVHSVVTELREAWVQAVEQGQVGAAP